MEKVKLEVEELAVETFITTDAGLPEGTVAGHEGRTITIECGTCEVSCQITACFDYTCDYTCGCV